MRTSYKCADLDLALSGAWKKVTVHGDICIFRSISVLQLQGYQPTQEKQKSNQIGARYLKKVRNF